jgi:glutaminyl-tRNA synthetase
MPTIAGMRRRGVPSEALRDFVKRIGVAKANSVVDMGMFEYSVREVLNKSAQRRMAVLRPLKIVIENYPEGQSEELDAVNHPDDPSAGSRKFALAAICRRDDFMENHRRSSWLSPGKEVVALYLSLPWVARRRRESSGALHLRSGDARRQRAGRPQGAGDAALGVGEDSLRPRCGSTPIVHQPNPMPQFAADLNQFRIAGRCARRPALAVVGTGEPVQFERQNHLACPGSQPASCSTDVGLRDTWAKCRARKTPDRLQSGGTCVQPLSQCSM